MQPRSQWRAVNTSCQFWFDMHVSIISFGQVTVCAHAAMMMTEKKANAMAKIRVAQLRPIARPRRSPNMAIHVSSRMLSLPAPAHERREPPFRGICLFGRATYNWVLNIGSAGVQEHLSDGNHTHYPKCFPIVQRKGQDAHSAPLHISCPLYARLRPAHAPRGSHCTAKQVGISSHALHAAIQGPNILFRCVRILSACLSC